MSDPHSELEFEGSFEIVEQLNESQVRDLLALLNRQWWGKKRTLNEVQQMIQHTSLLIGIIDRATEKLIGSCRTLTDFTFRATIFDVMVREDFQGRGLGGKLLETMCAHPRLESVNFIYLACDPAMYSFYERWGFEVYDRRAHWMIKVQREEEGSA